MANPTHLTIDCGTGEAVTSPLTPAETDVRDALRTQAAADLAAAQQAETARVGLYDAFGPHRQAMADALTALHAADDALQALVNPTQAQVFGNVKAVSTRQRAAIDAAAQLFADLATVLARLRDRTL